MSQFYQRRAKPDIQSESLGQTPNSLASVSDAPVRAGDVLADKYRVERILGTGGMGVVVAATNVGLGKPVAIKMMLPSMLATPRAIERFEREARAVVQLKSEHVAEVLDIGKLSNGAPYIVMELLEGSDFEELLRERTFAIEEAIAYVLQACEAVAEAHSLGIVHRDLKPRNLFLTRRLDGTPLVKVLDFGISKWTPADAEAHSLTRTSDVIGSPNYMSPEQIRSAKDVDARTDIWSLGIIVFELLTGRVPFLAEGLPHLCALILEQDAPLVSTLRPDVPAELVTIVARCLDRDPEKRFQSVAELVLALKPFAPSSPSASHGQQLTSSSPRGSWAPSRLASTGSPVANAPGATPRPSSSARVHVGNGTSISWAETLLDGLRARRRLRWSVLAGLPLVSLVAMSFVWFGLRTSHVSGAPLADGAAPAEVAGPRMEPPLLSSTESIAPSATPLSSDREARESPQPTVSVPPRAVRTRMSSASSVTVPTPRAASASVSTLLPARSAPLPSAPDDLLTPADRK